MEVPSGDGEAAIQWLRRLRLDWLAVLSELTDAELDATAPLPWPHNPDRTLAHMIGWVNVELMKNTAEIGQFRTLRAASTG